MKNGENMNSLSGHAFRGLLTFLMGCLLLACQSGGPGKTLSEMAKALRQNDSEAFISGIDLGAFAANELKGITKNNAALDALDNLGKMLGLGNMDSMVEKFVDLPARLREQFYYGVSTGELAAQCRQSTGSGCPWTAEALAGAKIVRLDNNAAVAKVTVATGLTTWLALSRFGDDWKVVGMAPLEAEARAYALAPGQKPAQAAPAGQPQSRHGADRPATRPDAAPVPDGKNDGAATI